VIVASVPANATIEIDGRAVGRTPARVDGLVADRPVLVAVRLDGHRPQEQTVLPSAGAATRVDVTLEPASGRLSLDAEPWAEVFVDDERIGDTPVLERQVRAGRRTVRLRHAPSGREVSLSLDVAPDAHVRRRVRLDDTPAANPRSDPAN
jgi:hypothetical protein